MLAVGLLASHKDRDETKLLNSTSGPIKFREIEVVIGERYLETGARAKGELTQTDVMT